MFYLSWPSLPLNQEKENTNITKITNRKCKQCLRTCAKKCQVIENQTQDNNYLHNLLFADDQVIITQDTDDAPYMTRKLNEEYGKWGLQINMNKIQYLTVNMDDQLIT